MKQNTLPFEEPSLFKRLTLISTLRLGFKEVRKNKGAPGIDGVTVSAFEANLNEELVQLQKELRNWDYKPSPVRRVEIPKRMGGTRKLGVPCVRDRVVQAGLKRLLEPILEAEFSDNSFGARPKRSAEQAVEQAHRIVASGKPISSGHRSEEFFRQNKSGSPYIEARKAYPRQANTTHNWIDITQRNNARQ